MTYQESFAQALKLKDFVFLYDKNACIYLFFSSPTEFTVKVFDQAPDDEIQAQFFVDSVLENNLPIAKFAWSEFSEIKVFYYVDPEFTLTVDINTDEIISFVGPNTESIPLEVLRQEALGDYNQLISKLK